MGTGKLRIIDGPSAIIENAADGKLVLTWSKDNVEQIALAQKTFNEYLNKGWFAIGEAAGKKTQIFTFNADLEEIVLTQFVMGG
jgi:hypothetical protein